MAQAQQEQKEKLDRENRLKTTPQIRNINSEPSLSFTNNFPLNEGDSFIGKKSSQFMPHVVLSGIGIANKHCCINYNSDEN